MKRVHKFTAAVIVDDKRIDVVLTVNEDANGKFHYSVNRDTGIAESISAGSRGGPEGRLPADGRGDASKKNIVPDREDGNGSNFQRAVARAERSLTKYENALIEKHVAPAGGGLISKIARTEFIKDIARNGIVDTLTTELVTCWMVSAP